MVRTQPHGHLSLVKPFFAISTIALLFAGFFVLRVPDKIAHLGAGNLDHLVAPTETAAYEKPIVLAGRGGRPPLEVTATWPVPARSGTKKLRALPGHRLWAVRFTVRDVGASGWLPTTADLKVADATGDTYGVDRRVRRLRGQPMLRRTRVLEPGHSITGAVAFSLPLDRRPVAVRVTVGSGLTRTGVWTPTGD